MMLDSTDSYVTEDGRTIGGVVMEMKNITLKFGGVVAIKDIDASPSNMVELWCDGYNGKFWSARYLISLCLF